MNITQLKRKRSPHQPVGRWIRVEKRLAIYLRDGFVCQLCGCDLHGVDPFDITLDHFVPKKLGGNNSERNVFTCCRSCNSSRQTSDLTKAQRKRVAIVLNIDIAAFKRLAKSFNPTATFVKHGKQCECTSCGFKTRIIGLDECPGCKEAA